MYVITKNDGVITNLTSIVQGEGVFFTNHDGTNFQKDLFAYYEISEIPEGIEPFTHCYTPEKGFYPYEPPKPELQPPTPLEELTNYVLDVDFRLVIVEMGLI
ncbi:hypothetical protein V7127_02640 [Bacillus sp. JJ1773]|uniref:hypothetical protein n=1 Tax=Bacillus sp. JJ1773 TaxID=3122965 RepID=UPI002FFD78BE